MKKSGKKYQFNPQYAGMQAFVVVNGRMQAVTAATGNQILLEKLSKTKPHLVIVSESETESVNNDDIITAALKNKKITFSPKNGYKFKNLFLGKNKEEAAGFVEANPDIYAEIAK